MQPDGVVIDNESGMISIRFTPTIPHCSMSTLIGCALAACRPRGCAHGTTLTLARGAPARPPDGDARRLCIRVKLLRSIPSRFKVDVTVTPGSHASEHQVNKQLNDKERVAAALENASLVRPPASQASKPLMTRIMHACSLYNRCSLLLLLLRAHLPTEGGTALACLPRIRLTVCWGTDMIPPCLFLSVYLPCCLPAAGGGESLPLTQQECSSSRSRSALTD